MKGIFDSSRVSISILFVLWVNSIYAQDLIFYGVQPSISITKVLTPKLEVITNSYSFMHPYGSKQHRVYYRPIDWQFYFQAGFAYRLTSRLKLEGGYVLQRTNSSGIETDHTFENRPWQGLVSNVHLTKNISLFQRFRTEERFLYNWDQYNHVFSFRVRYRVGLKVKLKWKQGQCTPYYITGYNESFITPYEPTTAIYNENRSYLAMGYALNSIFSFEAGYFMQYIIRNYQRDYRILNLLQLSWIIKLD